MGTDKVLKWYTLRVLAILLSVMPAAALAVGLINAVNMESPSSEASVEDVLIIIFLAFFLCVSLLFVWAQWQTTGTLMRYELSDLKKAQSRAFWGLVSGSLLLAIWVVLGLAGIISLFSEPGFDFWMREQPSYFLLTVSTALWMFLCIAAFMLAINIYFEVGRRRRRSEEEMLLSIGQRPIGHP
jgi:hypothetical protein